MSLTSLTVNGKRQLVDTFVVGNNEIEGAIDGVPVTLYRKGDKWYTDMPEDGKLAANVLISEDLEPAIATYLDLHPKRSLDDLIDAALSLYLLQQGGLTQIPSVVKRRYLANAVGAAATPIIA